MPSLRRWRRGQNVIAGNLPQLPTGGHCPYALLLQSQLRERFPKVRVFMDLDSIEPGSDFVEVIRSALDSCTVLVALIGRQWATLTDEEGRRRLDNRDDFVRFDSIRRGSAP